MKAAASHAGTITLPRTFLYVALSAVSFHLAYTSRVLSGLVLGYVFCVVLLARAKTARRAFYSGLAVGLLTVAPQLTCFWRIFGAPALVLWIILAFWIGGKDPAPGDNFYNTAFVIGPDGDEIFRQVKAVPIQLFRDGLPAPRQEVWHSPWGRIGICVCYDLSYRRVTDRLIAQGAEALICPTMDVADWGRHQHELHARVAPVRAAEYGVPILRVASSGISQLVDADGRVAASAPFPGQLATLSGRMQLRGAGHLPLDHWLAPIATLLTALAILSVALQISASREDSSDRGCVEDQLQKRVEVSPARRLEPSADAGAVVPGITKT